MSAPFVLKRLHPFGAPLQIAPVAVVVPIIAGWFSAEQVMRLTLLEPVPPVPIDPGALSLWLERYASLATATRHPSLAWVIATGACVALMYVLSVLAHELGHVAAARAYGLQVDAIDLGMTGGFVTLHDSDRLTAGSLGAIAGAGPAVTAAIAGTAWVVLLALGWPVTGAPDLATSPGVFAQKLLSTTFQLNAVCLVLNLLPIRPLDGHKLRVAAHLRRSRNGL